MARKINRLSARTVATVTKPGRHADGNNLYLSVSPTGAKSWVFMFTWQGCTREIGLGSVRSVPLGDARVFAASARSQLARGVQPTGPRASMGGRTFADCVKEVLEAMAPRWRSSKHAKQWEMTLTRYAAPLSRLPVDTITTEHVLGVLKPLWKDRFETARRLRTRIERV